MKPIVVATQRDRRLVPERMGARRIRHLRARRKKVPVVMVTATARR
jgi:hypothetical protein